MKTGDIPPCQTSIPYKVQLNDRRHGGGLGNDCNNDYGLAPPNRNLVRYMVKRGRGKKEVKQRSAKRDHTSKTSGKRQADEKDVGPLIRDETFDTKSLRVSLPSSHPTGSLDSAKGNRTDGKTQKVISQSKVGFTDSNKYTASKSPKDAKNGEKNTEAAVSQSLIGAKDNGKASHSRSPLFQSAVQVTKGDGVYTPQDPVIVPGKNGFLKPHVPVVVPTEQQSTAPGSDEEDYERIWSADDSSDSDEDISGKRSHIRHPLTNRSGLKLTHISRRKNNRPSLLSIDDFSKKMKKPSGILYKRRQAHEFTLDNNQDPKSVSIFFSKAPIEVYSQGQVGFNSHNTSSHVLNSHHQKVNVIGERTTIHNPEIAPITPIRKHEYRDETGYKQFSRQPTRGQPPTKLPSITPSGNSSLKKEHKKIKSDFASQLHSSEEYALW